jgi:hypothetical protein
MIFVGKELSGFLTQREMSGRLAWAISQLKKPNGSWALAPKPHRHLM